jgi:hypothetical protein
MRFILGILFSLFLFNSFLMASETSSINSQVESIVSSFAEDVNAVYPLKDQNAKFKTTMDSFYSDFRAYLTEYLNVYDKLPPIIGSDAIKNLDSALKEETGTTVKELNDKMKSLTRTIDRKISPEIFKYLAKEKYKAQHKAAKKNNSRPARR